MKSITKIGLMLMVLAPAFTARGQITIPAPSTSFSVNYTLPAGYPNIDTDHETVGGTVYIYTSDPNKKIDNPIIVPEGFDPDNSKNWPELYYAFNEGQWTMECLYQLGYDFVIINNNDGGNFMEHNAYLFTKVVEWVNSTKTTGEKNIVIGPSMGGVVARYGLTYMEYMNINHDTRLFISLDAPQYGANVPMGLQHVIKYFKDAATDKESADAKKKYAMLKSNAARQMLLYHVDAANNHSPHALRYSFDQNLHALGDWPKKLRMVATSNGSGYGLKQLKDDNVNRLQSGDAILDFKAFKGDVAGDVIFGRAYAVPDNVSAKIARCKEFWDADPNDYYIESARPMDNMAGGYRAFSGEMETVVNTADAGRQCFIPLFSALAITTADNNYSVFGDANVMSKTPFAAIYCPNENEQHVQITSASHNWLLQEIMPDRLDVNTTFLAKGNVNLQARTEVRLLPGFSTGTNPTFRIFVGDFGRCNHAAPLATNDENSTDVATGIDAVEPNSDQVSIYPNPASDFVTIAIHGQELKQIELMQADGKLLKTVQPQQATYELDLNDVNAGMYFIRVSGNRESIVKKIVVTH